MKAAGKYVFKIQSVGNFMGFSYNKRQADYYTQQHHTAAAAAHIFLPTNLGRRQFEARVLAWQFPTFGLSLN